MEHQKVSVQHAPGGQAGMSSNIENYLGFPSGLSGNNLARRAAVQAVRFGAEILIHKRLSVYELMAHIELLN
jgi:thioredoxin reductase (NADPH)